MQGLRSTSWWVQNRQGVVKNGMGNGVAEELICMIHGHALRQGTGRGNGGVLGGGGKVGKSETIVIA